MFIEQFRYGTDNLGYVICKDREAVAVDGGAVDEILSFIENKGLDLKYVVNTHGHGDHTVGTRSLVDQAGAKYLDNGTLRSSGQILLASEIIKVYHTPGHTADSLSFHVGNTVITGDTLFNATVGNCFSGDLKGFYHSIKRLLALPDDTIVYAGHDYVEESLAFARMVEPENPELVHYADKYDPSHVFSTMEDERKVNPFLRFNEPTIIAYLENKRLPVGTEYERWESVMTL